MNPKVIITLSLGLSGFIVVAAVLWRRRRRLGRARGPRWLAREVLGIAAGVAIPPALAYLVMMPCYRRALEEQERLRDAQGIESTGARQPAGKHRRRTRD